MSIKTLAVILLVGHLVAVAIILSVIRKQVKILKQKPDPELHAGRVFLSISAVGILLGNAIPLVVDAGVLFDKIHRTHPTAPGVAYALSNMLTLNLLAGAMFATYVVAEKLLKKKR